MTAIQPHNPPNRRCLKLTGEIDLANAADYLGTARKMIAECRTDPSFIIDLPNVTFMDSTALGMLVNIRRAPPTPGRNFGWRARRGALVDCWRSPASTTTFASTNP